jgi:hypothetical protein
MSDPELNELKDGEGLPRRWVSQVGKLLVLPGDLRRYFLVILARRLNWFYSRDQQWTEENLLAVLASDDRDNRQAIWSGFLWGCKTPQEKLYLRLKPEMLSFVKDRGLTRRGHEQVLAGIILAGWGSIHEASGIRFISNDELHDLILHCDDEFRSRLIWHFKEWSKNNEKWRTLLPELLQDVWPRQKSVKTATTSAVLFDLAFSNAERFNQIADLILPLLSAIKMDYLYMRHDMEKHSGFIP